MALSYYSNWAPLQQVDTSMADHQPELRSAFSDGRNIDYLFEPNINDFFYSENPNSLQYDFSNATLLQQESEPFHFPKRQKFCDYDHNDEDFYSDHLVKSSFFMNMLQDYSPPEIVVPPLPDFPSVKNEPPASSGGLSAQSIAARQRRRKITEKTQELGKLVPGGQKMNTAEMLQAAYKYIKYLQAQVGILEFIGSYHKENDELMFESDHEELLQVLLESPLIQEKLYSSEKCMVPQRFVHELSSDDQTVKSYPELLSVVKQEH